MPSLEEMFLIHIIWLKLDKKCVLLHIKLEKCDLKCTLGMPKVGSVMSYKHNVNQISNWKIVDAHTFACSI